MERNEFLELFYDDYITQLVAVLGEACEQRPEKPIGPGAARDGNEAVVWDGSNKETRAGSNAVPAAPQSPTSPLALGLICDLLCFCVKVCKGPMLQLRQSCWLVCLVTYLLAHVLAAAPNHVHTHVEVHWFNTLYPNTGTCFFASVLNARYSHSGAVPDSFHIF